MEELCHYFVTITTPIQNVFLNGTVTSYTYIYIYLANSFWCISCLQVKNLNIVDVDMYLLMHRTFLDDMQ